MDIAIVIEGQNGLNWSRWQRIARLPLLERKAGQFQSPDRDSLTSHV